jgi:hypothetical protein
MWFQEVHGTASHAERSGPGTVIRWKEFQSFDHRGAKGIGRYAKASFRRRTGPSVEPEGPKGPEGEQGPESRPECQVSRGNGLQALILPAPGDRLRGREPAAERAKGRNWHGVKEAGQELRLRRGGPGTGSRPG